MKVNHPCEGMTKAQVAAFERVAVGGIPNCKWADIDALMAKGLLARGPDETRRDAMGLYTVPNFYVPVHVHHQWCMWCSEQETTGA